MTAARLPQTIAPEGYVGGGVGASRSWREPAIGALHPYKVSQIEMTERINARMSAVGGVFDMSSATPRCIGSSSAFGSATTFVTAAHIVAGRRLDEIAVNHFGHSRHQFSPINEIVVDQHLDAALLDVVVEEPRWILPFTHALGAAWYGSEVASIGWPVDLLAPDADRETLRCFRGYIQRTFLYDPPGRGSYPAFELSFAAPPGLSGSPVFLVDEPTTLVGIVTANFSTHSLIEATEETADTTRAIQRTEYRSVITYGIATIAWHVWHAFEDRLPAVALASARQDQRTG